MPEPLVSIVIPAYNAERYLAETISSALGQTWTNTEIIVVDDGSQDNSLPIAKKFEAGNVQIISQQNKGASAARNLGLKKAKGKYIQFLDADDMISPDKIAVQVEALEKEPGKIAACSIAMFTDGSYHIDSGASPRDEPFIYSTSDVVDFLIDLYGGYKRRGSMIGIHSWLVPADIIEKSGPWNESLTVDDDGEFFCRVVLNSAGIVKTDGLSYYRRFFGDKKNLSARVDHKSLQSMAESFHLKKKYLLQRTNADAAYLALYKQALNLAIKTYILYPELYRQINKELKEYSHRDYHPIIGGSFLNLIARIFGWRTARFLQYYYSKV